jgi:hypothetical protein
MKEKKYIPLFEDFVKKINEGGGAGIQFNAKYEDNIILEVYKGNVKVTRDIAPTYSFDIEARGYDDGGKIEDLELPVKSNLDTNKLLSLLKQVTFRDMVYNVSEDDVIRNFDLTESELEHIYDKTLFDYSNDTLITIEINIDIDFDPMFFAGWTRGSFDVGDVLFNNSDYDMNNYTAININGCVFTQTRTYKEDYSSYKRKVLNGINDFDFINLFVPTVYTNEKFIEWYMDVFENDYDEDEYEDD